MNGKLKRFLSDSRDGVFYIGHASALVRMQGKYILFDPIWNAQPYGKYWIFHPEQINCDAILPLVDACVVSHEHADHLNESILSKLDCQVSIMRGRKRITNKMNSIIWTDEKYAFLWEELLPGIEIYFVPHDFNSIDSSCFLRTKDFCVYVGNDNFLSERLLKKIKPDISFLDVALLPSSFIHWYPHLLQNITDEERKMETDRLNKQSIEQAELFIKEMNPEHTFTFGDSLLYADSADHILNRSLQKIPAREDVHHWNAGDMVFSNGAEKPLSLEYFFVNEKPKFTPLEPIYASNAASFRELDIVREKLKNCQRSIPGHSLLINGININLETKNVSHKVPSGPYTKFTINDDEYYEWLEGKITFEQVIGTRRFSCIREPNVYNLAVFEFFNNEL